METLPEKLQEAFKTQNTPLLKEGFAELSPEEFKYVARLGKAMLGWVKRIKLCCVVSVRRSSTRCTEPR